MNIKQPHGGRIQKQCGIRGRVKIGGKTRRFVLLPGAVHQFTWGSSALHIANKVDRQETSSPHVSKGLKLVQKAGANIVCYWSLQIRVILARVSKIVCCAKREASLANDCTTNRPSRPLWQVRLAPTSHIYITPATNTSLQRHNIETR
jgi:hypothetical protein